MRDTKQNPARLTDRPAPGGLLRTLGEMDLRALEQFSRPCKAIRGQVLLETGDTASHVALLYEGVALDLIKSDGRWIAAEILIGGDLAGEAKMLPHHEYAHRVVAQTDVTYALTSHSEFTSLLHRHPFLATAVVEYVAGRRAGQAHSRAVASTETPRVRFARTLSDLYTIYTNANWKPQGDIPLQRDDLSGLTGIPRTQINRLIPNLTKVGIIRAGSAYVSIVDVHRLRQLC